MDQLIVQVGERLGRLAEFARSQGDVLKVGRSFVNDLVVTDLYVDPEQLVFYRSPAGWKVKVMDETNPALLNGGVIDKEGSLIRSGDRLTVGRTQLRVYASDHAVESTHKLIVSSWLGHGRSHPLFAFLMLLFAVSAVSFISYQEQSTELVWNVLLLAALYTGLAIVIWAGIWALVGRLLRHQPNFTAQLGLTALITGISTLATPLAGYVEYAANSLLLGEIAMWSILLVTWSALLRANLMFATNLKHYSLIAVFATSAILAISFSTLMFSKEEFNYTPDYSTVLKPPFAHLSANQDAKHFRDSFGQAFEKVDIVAKEQ